MQYPLRETMLFLKYLFHQRYKIIIQPWWIFHPSWVENPKYSLPIPPYKHTCILWAPFGMSCEYVIVLMAVPLDIPMSRFSTRRLTSKMRSMRKIESSSTSMRTGTSPSQLPVGSQGMTWALPRLCLKTSAVLWVSLPCVAVVFNWVMWPFLGCVFGM